MILFIDDDKTHLAPWTGSVTDAGYKVHIEVHPDDALEALHVGRNFTAAIVDIMMPSGSLGFDRTDGGLRTGLVLVQKMRKLDSKLPIVFLSIRNDLREEATKHGIPFISKSMNMPSDLVEALRDLGVEPDSGD